MADGRMDDSIHIHSQDTSCLTCEDLSVSKQHVSVSQWKGEEKKKGMFEYPDMRNESKTVTEGEKRRDINNLGVKMADRWMAAGRKSLFARFTNLLALLSRKIHDSSLFLPPLPLF